VLLVGEGMEDLFFVLLFCVVFGGWGRGWSKIGLFFVRFCGLLCGDIGEMGVEGLGFGGLCRGVLFGV
jgi:hypothetical protein